MKRDVYNKVLNRRLEQRIELLGIATKIFEARHEKNISPSFFVKRKLKLTACTGYLSKYG